MAAADDRAQLHIVTPSPKRNPLTALIRELPAQIALFPTSQKRLLVFLVFSRVSDLEFVETIQAVKPHFILDIRRFPRFDNGRLNRQTAFECFDRAHSKYVDLLWSDDFGSPGHAHPLISFEFATANGPIVILLEPKQSSSEIVDSLANQVSTRSNQTWDVIGLPSL